MRVIVLIVAMMLGGVAWGQTTQADARVKSIGIIYKSLDASARSALKAKGFDLPFSGGGVVVIETVPGMPASGAGIKAGDVIRRVEGNAISGGEDFSATIQDALVDTKVRLDFCRLSQVASGGKTVWAYQTANVLVVWHELAPAKDAPRVAAITSGKEPDFRKITWGMTKDEVLKAEASDGLKPSVQDSNLVTFENIEVVGTSASLMYSFKDGRVYSAAYLFDESDTPAKSLGASYRIVSKALESKYGNPTRDFSDPGSSVSEGVDIALGQTSYRQEWTLPKVIIRHMIFGSHAKIHHGLWYTEINVGKEVEKEKAEKAKGDL